MNTTSKDIAKKLGLSQPTVSRILNEDPHHRASVETRNKVHEAARQMGYRPNAVARALRKKKTGVLGFYTDHKYSDKLCFQSNLTLGALQYACEADRIDILRFHNDPTEHPTDLCDRLMDGRIDGLFLHIAEDNPLLEHLVRSSLPVVVTSYACPVMHSVITDDESGVDQMVDYLWSQGHRKIAHLVPRVPNVAVKRWTQAFRTNMEKRGELKIALMHTTLEDIDVALNNLRSMTDPPTAVCCYDNSSAVALIRACSKNHIQVPRDLAVTGFGGSTAKCLTSQELTMVTISWTDMGNKAIETMLALIKKDKTPSEVRIPLHVHPGNTA